MVMRLLTFNIKVYSTTKRIFEKIIYIECRQRGHEPNEALEETKRQIEERKKEEIQP